MPVVGSIYDSDPIQPVVHIEQNLRIYTRTDWAFFRVDYIEPMPRGSALIVDMVVVAGATTIAAYGTITKRVVPILQLNDLEFLQVRWEPIDDVEGILWEQSANARYVSRGTQARVDLSTAGRDPYLATTTIFILGRDRDMNLQVANPNPVALPQARFRFWGYRYMLTALSTKPANYTSLPAEGK